MLTLSQALLKPILTPARPELDFVSSASSTANLTTYTFSAQVLRQISKQGSLIVLFVAASGTGAASITAVTIGGRTPTTVIATGAIVGPLGIFQLAAPNLRSGDVVVTFDSGRQRCAIVVSNIFNLRKKTAVATVAATGSAATTVTGTLLVPQNGVLVCGVETTNLATATSWSGLLTDEDEEFDATVESNFSVASAGGENRVRRALGSVTATFAAAANSRLVAASWR